MPNKASTFLHILEGIGRAVDPRIGTAIDGVKAIHDAKGDARVAAILREVDTSLELAGDYSGKDAISDPALRALLRKYVEDGQALHAYIETHKAKPVAGDVTGQVTTGSTGE